MYNTDFFRLLVDITNYVEFNITLNCVVCNILKITFSVVAIIVIFKIIDMIKEGIRRGYFDD